MNKLHLAATSLADAAPVDFIRATAEAGFDGIGIRLHRSPVYPNWHPILGDAALMGAVKSELASSGLEFLDIFTFYVQSEMDWETMEAAIAFGAELGASWVQSIGDDPEWSRMRDSFGRLCDLAGRYGLGVTLEAPVNSRVVNSMPKAVQLIADCGRENMAIVLDPGQFHQAGHTPDVLHRLPARLFPYAQFNDVLPDRGGRCAPGAGEVPLAAILDELPAELPLSLEWGPPRGSDYTPAEWAKHAMAGARAFLHGYDTSRPAPTSLG
ncbi:MAG TPA: sugar phosphate isomerase/epimerase [Chloroflexota bacterium]|nr:sugar phosphate isomerase/epimerase [Chloroflexota bacterium]